MTDTMSASTPVGLTAEISQSLEAPWVKYADDPPSEVRTEIRGGVVTCVLVDAVASFNRKLLSSHDVDTDIATEFFTLKPSARLRT